MVLHICFGHWVRESAPHDRVMAYIYVGAKELHLNQEELKW